MQAVAKDELPVFAEISESKWWYLDVLCLILYIGS